MEKEKGTAKEAEKAEEPKTAKELKGEFFALRNEEIERFKSELMQFCVERDIDLGSKTIIEENGQRRNEIFIIDKL